MSSMNLTAWNETHALILALVKTKFADIKILVLDFKGLKSSLIILHTFWFCITQSSHHSLFCYTVFILCFAAFNLSGL